MTLRWLYMSAPIIQTVLFIQITARNRYLYNPEKPWNSTLRCPKCKLDLMLEYVRLWFMLFVMGVSWNFLKNFRVCQSNKDTFLQKYFMTFGTMENSIYMRENLTFTASQYLQFKIYDVPMKFACKLIHGGPVHPCCQPVGALQQCMVLS